MRYRRSRRRRSLTPRQERFRQAWDSAYLFSDILATGCAKALERADGLEEFRRVQAVINVELADSYKRQEAAQKAYDETFKRKRPAKKKAAA
jgi:hypothetical protein